MININFAVFDVGMAFLQAGLALAEGFNLGSGKDDSAFIGFFDEVIVPGFLFLAMTLTESAIAPISFLSDSILLYQNQSD